MLRKKVGISAIASLLLAIVLVSSASAAWVFNEPMSWFNSATWQKADGYSNGNMFNCTWRANNVNFTSSGQLELKITSPSYNKFDCAEYRSTNKYGFGKYEVNMKPAKNTGIVSSFFTYTGPSDGTQWDEIDIEFLGKDTTKVQFNYYTNGVGGHEKIVNLGFDASQGYHTYAFDWQSGYIKWYVDGVLKHTATSNIPQTPGKIMMNLWNGTGVDAWLGSYNGNNPLYAYYDWVKYTSN
ncbi:glycoside hydrolase family 16 protein [Paenibacillus sp. PR3]|uniref:Beta-glucanase n=1 Tax=Paenibacillus terricola TaxID=2763503 RepID=A0ABR8MV82_9BACL|nr:glycoside hydrolase family 16 protein [Paenibacillus terricola]MBD3919883.1 glycoside hydrolase family 16 protein [Paenibacillus terricola]